MRNMTDDVFLIACLRLDQVPHLLLGASDYDKSTCDFCSTPIWVVHKVLALIKSAEAAKACTSCIGLRLRAVGRLPERLRRKAASGWIEHHSTIWRILTLFFFPDPFMMKVPRTGALSF